MRDKSVARASEAGGRERLLAAAVRIFAAKGYAATTVREILQAAAVTAPVLYYHFGNKEGLFLALVEQGFRNLEVDLDEASRKGATAAAKIRGFCRTLAAIRREHAGLARIVETTLLGPPQAGPKLDMKGPFSYIVRRLEDLVRAGTAAGEFRKCNPTHAALALLGTVEMVARPHLFGLTELKLDDQLDGIIAVVLRGLAAPAA